MSKPRGRKVYVLTGHGLLREIKDVMPGCVISAFTAIGACVVKTQEPGLSRQAPS